MRRWLLVFFVLQVLTAALLRADYTPAPLNATLVQQSPYQFVGMIMTSDPNLYFGSGVVVGNSKLVISCAHVPFNATSLTWSTDNLWYRAYEGSSMPTPAAGQVLRSYWKFASYASMVSAHTSDSLEAFAVDFTAYYAYENLGPGCAGFWYDGQSALVNSASKAILGYPIGLYSNGDWRQFLMHETGPFSLSAAQYWNSFNEIVGVSTGPGNSGGPVFVTNEASLTDADQGLRFSAVLISLGTDPTTGASMSGVVAVTAPEWDLVNDSLNALGATPLNDAWSKALKISGAAATSKASNQYATKEAGEPNHAGNAGGHSLWWRWTAPGDGPVTVDTMGSAFNTLLGVYTGSSVGSLTVVASNDDSGDITSAATFTAAAGTEYWIAVDGKNGATGSATVNLNFTPPTAPANDAFANATAISGISAQVIGHNINASKEAGEPDFVYTDGSGKTSAGGRSVWWKWTAPADGQVFLTTGGTAFDTLLAVYTGTAINALTLVASDDDPDGTYHDSSTLTFTATSGTTYLISVDGWSDATNPVGSGAISLSLNLTPNVPVIVVQPVTNTPNVGDTAILAVAARGASPLTYQWYKDGVAIAGATGASYIIGSLQVADIGNYTVLVTNGNGSVTSNVAFLTPRGYPVITSEPAGQAVGAGTTVSFTVAASSPTTLSYLWQKDGVSLSDGGRIAGSTATTLTISNVQTTDAGNYAVVVTNGAGSINSTPANLAVIPILISGGVVAISAGGGHTLLVGSDGSLWAAGDNTYGQLGDGTTVSKNCPVQVAANVVVASAGGTHSLFIKSDGSLWGMGLGGDGKLGAGQNYTNQSTPIQIATGVVAASAGSDHSLFIKSDGTLWAMGSNSYGQLGDGTTNERDTPVQVATRVVAAFAGQYHSLFIKSDGSLWAMGNNFSGQLGDGTNTFRPTPVQIAIGVVTAAAGADFSLFLKSDGTLWGSGNGNNGQIGVNGWWNSTPVLVASGVAGVSAGYNHTLFLKSDASLWALGDNSNGQLGDGTINGRRDPGHVGDGVAAGSAGTDYSVFLKTDGGVWAIGRNYSGQLGDGTNTNRSNPVPMIGGTASLPGPPAGLVASAGTVVGTVRLSWNPAVGAARYEIWRNSSNDFGSATLIASDVSSAIYFDQTATLGTTYYYWVMAANQAGTSGAGNVSSGYSVPWIAPIITTQPANQTVNCDEYAAFSATASGEPAPILQWQRAPAGSSTWSDLIESSTYVGVTSTTLTVSAPTFAMNGDQIRCVATNTGGQAFSNAATLTVKAVAGVVAVAGGQMHSLFVRADGTLWAMGNNSSGQLGDGTTADCASPKQISSGIAMATAGSLHSLFVRVDGTLWATGDNSCGQLGDGTTTNRSSPVQVASGVVAVAAGDFHSLFVKSDGTLWAMGTNWYGELGDGTNTPGLSPVQVASGVVAVAARSGHSLFVKSDGTLWAMGDNSFGELGDRTPTFGFTPVQVASGVITVATGTFHSLFVKSDGTLWAMGYNAYGELGAGAQTNGPIPVQVASGVVAAAAGNYHSLFAKSDGTLWAMGDNESGQLGDGTNSLRASPVQVASGVVAVAAGNCQSLFAKLDGSLWAMGDNHYGELGDGSLIDRWTPVQVGGGLAQLPGLPTGLIASSGAFPCAVLLSWNPVIGANHYEVWRNTSNAVASASLVAGNVINAVYGDSTAAPATVCYYWVRAVNFAGASDFSGNASGFIPLIVPAVTTQPVAQRVLSGGNVSFSATATGSPAPSYRWQCSVNGGNDWSNLANDGSHSDVTTATLSICSTTPAMRGQQFRCVVDNGVGSVVTAPVMLTVDPALMVTTFAGTANVIGNADGTGSAAQFVWPTGGAIDGSGKLFVADTVNCTIRKVTPAGVVSTLAGFPGNSGSADGASSAAQFSYPRGVATDGSGCLYVADTYNSTIRRVTPAGVVTTIAGVAGHVGSTDGSGSVALFNYPSGIVADGSGNTYVADTNNHTIRKVTPVGVVTTVAGTGGLSGSADGIGTGAQFNSPQNIAIDATGNLYVTDTNNSTIRKVTPAGVVTTIAGLAGYYSDSSDGTGSAARFAQPSGIAVDFAGNLYVTDGNYTIRRITPSGVVTTVAGVAGYCGRSDGTGSAVQFYQPHGLAVDSTGNLYVMDSGNATIRKGVFEAVPLLTGQPSDEAAATGQSVTFAVGLSGWSPANCQWQCSTNGGAAWGNLANDGMYSGVTTSALTIANVAVGMNGWQYRCRVSSSTQAAETSSAATLKLSAGPSITAQPVNQATSIGSSAGFTAAANGDPAPGYQWQVSVDGGATWNNAANGGVNPGYLGAGTTTLTVDSATLAMNGCQYRCVASNGAGSATSSTATLTVFTADQTYLQRLFRDVLGREIDAGALNSFAAALAGGQSRASVLEGLLASQEYNLRQIEPAIRLYYAALARPPDYTGLQNWSNALHNGTLTLTTAADQFAGSAEFLLHYGSLDNTGYVQQLYRNVLGREADPAGLADWVGQLNAGASRGTVLVGFSESVEFKANLATEVEILRLYFLFLQRMPTTNELQSWLGFFNGDDQTETLLAQGYPAGLAGADFVQVAFRGFLRREADAGALSAFSGALGAGTFTHGGLVDTLLSSAEFSQYVGPASRLYLAAFRRVPDATGLDNWINYMRAGNSLESVGDAFVVSPEFQLTYGTLNDAQFVTLLYENVLGREPDPTGLADWTAQLGAGATRGQILIGFSESQESIHLFGPTLRTFLHYFTFLNTAPTQQDLDYWKDYMATLDDQMRVIFMDSAGLAN
jgi:alpha-tubulin suppressor-like RCC1 family protein